MGGVGTAAMLTALPTTTSGGRGRRAAREAGSGTGTRRPRGSHAGHRRRPQGPGGDRGRRASRGTGDRVGTDGARRQHVTVGLPRPDARLEISPLGFVAEGRSLIGSYLGSSVPARDIPRFVDMWRAGRLPVEELVSSTIELDRINEGMDQLADGKAVRQ